jgi:hypothetical protein
LLSGRHGIATIKHLEQHHDRTQLNGKNPITYAHRHFVSLKLFFQSSTF